jgi:hypothetical protein
MDKYIKVIDCILTRYRIKHHSLVTLEQYNYTNNPFSLLQKHNYNNEKKSVVKIDENYNQIFYFEIEKEYDQYNVIYSDECESYVYNF